MFTSLSNFRDEEELMGLGEGQDEMLSNAMKQAGVGFFFLLFLPSTGIRGFG